MDKENKKRKEKKFQKAPPLTFISPTFSQEECIGKYAVTEQTAVVKIVKRVHVVLALSEEDRQSIQEWQDETLLPMLVKDGVGEVRSVYNNLLLHFFKKKK